MANKIKISIPQPCHENWQEMKEEGRGRFCNSCQKKVFDFTTVTDREIVNAFEKNNNLCGRFLNTQLDRDLIKPKEKNSLWLATTTALISLVGLNEVTAQEKTPTEQTEAEFIKGKSKQVKNEEIEVSGVVYDEHKYPLPGANVVVKRTKAYIASDIDGKFTVKASKGDILIISFVGYKKIEYKIKNATNTNIINFVMKLDKLLEVTVGMVCKAKKRTFFGRLFHKSKY